MSGRIFKEMIQANWKDKKSVCVGLDSDSDKIPAIIRAGEDKGITRFNCEIVDATRDLVCAYKPNVAFYESLGVFGTMALKATVGYIQAVAPNVPIIGDMKRGDTGKTNSKYAKSAFEYFGFDAITVNPYHGGKSLQSFLDFKNKGIFILCRTSDEGSDEFQDRDVVVGDRQVPFYQYVAHRVATAWNKNGNCGLVVGATYPEELALVRATVGGDMPILIPGIGEQGGDLEKTVKSGKRNMIINASRSVIFTSSGPDFAQAARKETVKLQKEINRYLLLQEA